MRAREHKRAADTADDRTVVHDPDANAFVYLVAEYIDRRFLRQGTPALCYYKH